MTRMRNGIIKRGSTYSYVVRERDPATGTSKQRWVGGFPTHAEAAAAKDLARVANRAGYAVRRSEQTLGEYLRLWAEHIDVKPKTRAGYAYHVEHYVVPRLGGLALQDLRPATLTKFYADLRATGGRAGGELGWRSIQAVHRTISSAFSMAVRQEVLQTNPAERAQLPPKPRDTPDPTKVGGAVRAFAPDELRRFLNAANQHRLGALFHLASFTGARRGELLFLRWDAINLDQRELLISGSRTLAGGRPVEGTTKGGRARMVSLDESTVEVLRAHRAAQLEDRLAAGPLWSGAGDYVFGTVRGEPLHADTPSSLMPRLCADAGVPRLRFHDLRHTHATILLSANVPVHEVADRLGHSDATVTLKVYASVLRERAQGLGDAFAAAVGS